MRRFFFVFLLAASAQARLSDSVVPTRYQLSFHPDLAAATFRGEETVEVDVRSATKSITLHSAEIELERVMVSSGGRTQRARVTLDPPDETVTFHLARAVSGRVAIRIRYRGTLNDQLRGFYLSRTESRRYAVTQFEATDARRAFPSFDEPGMKATFDISVVADKGDTAISNGSIVEDRPGPGANHHTLRFSTTPRMPTYLVALLVGDFQCSEGGVDGIPIRVCATPDKVRLTRFALRAAEKELAFYNGYYDLKYPYEKLDIIGIPDFEAGAMENTAAITFRETALLVDEASASVPAMKRVAKVVAHEIAHQWFGDLVTMRWWNDVWLNEGFADWITPKAVSAFRPGWGEPEEQAADTSKALTADALQSTHPIRVPVETPEEINEIFDAISYEKTAAVLRMVEALVGEAAFRDGIRVYVKKYAYGNAAAEDFWNTMTATTKQPFDRILPTFVLQPGAPLLSVDAHCDGDSTIVRLVQRRLFRGRARFLTGSSERWTIPLVIKDLDRPSTARQIVFSDASEDVKLPGCTPHLFVNRGGFGYYRTKYAPAVIDVDLRAVLTPPERISFLSDEWALVQIGERSIADHLALLTRFNGESDRGVFLVITEQMESIGRNLTTPADRARFATWVSDYLRPIAARLGWSPAPNESDEVRELRSNVLYTLGRTGNDPETLRHARQLAEAVMKDPAAVDPSLLETVLNVAAIGGDAALYDAYLAQLKKSFAPEVHYDYLDALAKFRDPALLARSLEYALSSDIRSQDRPRFIASIIENPAGGQTAWNYLQAHWKELQSRAPKWSMPRIVRSLGTLCAESSAGNVRAFFAGHSVPAAERSIRQSLETISACVETKALQSPRLEALFNQQPAPVGGGRGPGTNEEKH
jgi:aminopeptidase N